MSLIAYLGILPSNGRSPLSRPIEIGRRRRFPGKTKKEREEKDGSQKVKIQK